MLTFFIAHFKTKLYNNFRWCEMSKSTIIAVAGKGGVGPFILPEDYSWRIHVDEQMMERYGTPEQLAEYRRQAEVRGTPEHKAKNWMGSRFV